MAEVKDIIKYALGDTVMNDALSNIMSRVVALGGLENLSLPQRQSLFQDFCDDLKNIIFSNYHIQVTTNQLRPVIENVVEHMLQDSFFKKDLEKTNA